MLMIRLRPLLALYLLLVSNSLWAEAKPAEAGGGSEYFDLKPAFVVNYGGPGKKLRYIKADISLRLEEEGRDPVEHHMAQIRHEIVMLLTAQTEAAMATMEGREAVRQAALETVRKVLIKEEGQHFVVDLLFNAFIVQN